MSIAFHFDVMFQILLIWKYISFNILMGAFWPVSLIWVAVGNRLS